MFAAASSSAERLPSRARSLAVSLVAAVLFGFMAFGAKVAAGVTGGAFAAFVRFAGAAACVGIVVASGRVRLRPVGWPLLALRGVSGGVAVLLYFLSIDHLGVGLATLLNFTSPIFTALLSWAVLRERLARATIAGLAVALGGVSLVVLGQDAPARAASIGWIGVGLLSALGSGIAVTTIRAARRTDGAWEIFAAFTLMGMVCCAPFSFPPRAWPSPAIWALLAAVAVVSVVAQILMTATLKWLDAPTYGAVSQISVVLAFALGVGFLHERLPALSAVGSLVTIAGVALAARAAPVAGRRDGA